MTTSTYSCRSMQLRHRVREPKVQLWFPVAIAKSCYSTFGTMSDPPTIRIPDPGFPDPDPGSGSRVPDPGIRVPDRNPPNPQFDHPVGGGDQGYRRGGKIAILPKNGKFGQICHFPEKCDFSWSPRPKNAIPGVGYVWGSNLPNFAKFAKFANFCPFGQILPSRGKIYPLSIHFALLIKD